MSFLRGSHKRNRANSGFNFNSQWPEQGCNTRHSTQSKFANRHPDEYRIQELLSEIWQKKYKYYVKGGFTRNRTKTVTPSHVARRHSLPMELCLFEIKDPRIEMACIQVGMEIVSPSSKIEGEERARRIYTWRADEK
ncbi:hypothetical protein ACG9XL_17030 [Acinetobacter nosocomialis]|uniref:hypothetical protein n=1 Tax=Acinetobacter calcoaceticus/baumannii complex TaxID=909768 RepID=UPI00233EA663|nr:hypothetical protein [Acinetobacter baumannii]MDC5567250.1 hypothetical protein [Acinetobacter baumannii]MDK2172886.1 hypothetical protein [Acinetobacter baumannii]MDK2183662.1 hypothetical protein [Acinetobacter baumannii]MDK2329486.1 hypothetical protein [Acinetobacter baumannii]